MNASFAVASLSVLWMGILATVSPCPMGANIAAVSIIAAGGGRNPQNAFLTAFAYGAGRMLVHVILGVLLVKGLASAAGATAAMQAVPSKLAGPIFIILGALLSGWLEIPMPKAGARFRKKILGDKPAGPTQTFFVGCVFSLIPCPETAALFFGGMLPMAMEYDSLYALPLFFGLGTALPVMLIGYLLSLGVGKFANNLGQFRKVEPLLRGVTCLAFVGIGLYLTLSHVYHVL